MSLSIQGVNLSITVFSNKSSSIHTISNNKIDDRTRLNFVFKQIMQTFCLREVNIPDFDSVYNYMNYCLVNKFICLP